MENESKFRAELEKLLNRFSMENASDTPDFILANYLTGCLKAFNTSTKARDNWYGHCTSITVDTSEIDALDYEIPADDSVVAMMEARHTIKEVFESKGFGPGSLFHGYLCNVAMVLYDTIGMEDKETRDYIAEKILRLIFWD